MSEIRGRIFQKVVVVPLRRGTGTNPRLKGMGSAGFRSSRHRAKFENTHKGEKRAYLTEETFWGQRRRGSISS